MHVFRGTAALVLAAAIVSGCSEDPPWSWDVPIDNMPDAAEVDSTADVPDVADTSMDSADTTDISDPPSEDGFIDTIGMICSNDEECQNGLYCDGAEICPFGFCQRGAVVTCDDGVNCTLDSCNEETDSCENVTDDAACDDSNPCTDEVCDVSTDTCTNPPIDCGDGINCTLDTCDPLTGLCEHTISDEACDDLDDCTIDTCDVPSDTCDNELIDGDGDLYPPESCGGDDCNDADSSIHPGATETCGDGVDQDCDGFDGDEGTCECPTPITGNGTYTGTTSGSSSYDPTGCAWSSSGPEWIFGIAPTTTSTVTFTTLGTGFDTVLYVHASPCDTGTEIGCDDDGGSFLDSRLTVSLTGGSTYYLFLDGYSTSEYGAFTLTVSGM